MAIQSVAGVAFVSILNGSGVHITITSSVDGAVLEITDVSLVCNGVSQSCVSVNETNPLKEKGCLNICQPLEVTIDTSDIVDAIKEKKDYEPIVVCDIATGEPKIVTYTYDDSGLLSTVAYNLDGTIFTGIVGKCETTLYDRELMPICVNNTQWTKVFVFNTLTPSTVEAIIYIDETNTIQPAPINYSLGVCSLERVFISDEEIAITDAAPIQLTIPATANLAELQPQGCDIRYRFLLPVTSGKVIGNYTRLELESLSEVQNFNAIALAGQSGVIHVDYFFEPNLYNN